MSNLLVDNANLNSMLLKFLILNGYDLIAIFIKIKGLIKKLIMFVAQNCTIN